jgi:subtilase family serine protease
VLLAGSLLAAAPIALGASIPSAAATRQVAGALMDSAPRSIPPGASVVGSAAPRTRIVLDVTLNVRNDAKLQAMLAGVYDRHSPLFHHFLQRGQFARLFGATNDELARVEAWLRSVGLTPTGVAGNRLTVHAAGTIGAAARGLHTSFAAVRTAAGQLDYLNRTAPSVPAGVARYVQGIIGLDDLPAVHDNLAHAVPRHGSRAASRAPHGAGPTACSALASAASYQGTFTAGGLASYYAMSPLYTLGDNGQGVRVAIAEFEPNWRSDVKWFEQCYKATNVVNYVHIDGGTGMPPGPGSGEAALDIENVIGFAPRATIDVYQTPNTDMGAEDMYAKMVSTDVDKVISSSWGSCEPHTSSVSSPRRRPRSPRRTSKARSCSPRQVTRARRTASATVRVPPNRPQRLTIRAARPTCCPSGGRRRARTPRWSGTAAARRAGAACRRSTACRPTSTTSRCRTSSTQARWSTRRACPATTARSPT